MARLTITIDSEAIKDALVAYIANQGLDVTNKEVKVQMTAGRGANGYSAAITIISNTDSSTSIPNKVLTRELEYSKESLEEVEEEVYVDEIEEETDKEDSETTSLFT